MVDEEKWSSSMRTDGVKQERCLCLSLFFPITFPQNPENLLQNLGRKKKNPCRFIFSLRGLLILQLFCSIKPVISYLGFA